MNAIFKNDNSADTAREAIRRLAIERIAPTPENFARAYREAGGEVSADGADVGPLKVLDLVSESLIARQPDLLSAQRLREHIRQGAWAEAVKAAGIAVEDAFSQAGAKLAADWPRLLQRLLGQLDASSSEWTRARKLTAIEHILRSTAKGEAVRTREKLESLVTAWTKNTAASADKPGPLLTVATSDEDAVASADKSDRVLSEATAHAQAWRELALAALAGYEPHERRQSATAVKPDRFGVLRARLKEIEGAPDEATFAELRTLCAAHRAERLCEAAIRDRLKGLLRLVCENLNLFADDDAWVQGQVARIGQLLDAPLDEQVLSEAEQSLRAAVLRQAELKTNLVEAKAALKEMLTSLIDRLSSVATATGEYYRRIDESAGHIRNADDLDSLSKVVANLLDDTGNMRDGMQRTHTELNTARNKANAYEQRVQALEKELVEVSTLVRTDPLTQVLNRRGLNDTFAIEQARAERDGTELSLALLDIDNFKRLNDSLGHQIGDLALRHLADLVRGALRPTDTVARFGGEEFVILLPATPVEMGVTVLTRLQRLLTRALFMHKDEKILITFSAGITEYVKGETREHAIARADAALYNAKATGKNRVVTG